MSTLIENLCECLNNNVGEVDFNELKYTKGNIILSKDKKFRYYYSEIIEGTNRQNKITIIMFNPAKADVDNRDYTIKNTLEIIKDYTNYREFEIFNLYNFRSTKPNFNKKNDIISKNIELLKKLLSIENNENILLAWGNLLQNDIKGKGYEKVLSELKEILGDKNLYAVNLTKNGNPMHLSRQNAWRIKRFLKENKELIKLHKSIFSK